jgi:hypothetical protein
MSIRATVDTGNLTKLAEQAAQRATEIVMGELFGAFQQSFTAQAWTWPRETKRTVGTAGSPRNIIDTGSLRQSGYYKMTGPYQATFTWSANYATAVHEGALIFPWGNRDASRVQLPARPWTRAVLGQESVSGIVKYDVADRLKNVWLAQLRR